MSKKDYIDAINEIEVSEKLKKDTFSKTSKISTSTKYNKIYPIASLTLMCAIILAIILPNKNIAPISEINYQDVETSQELPKVENFRNLYAMLKTRAKNDNNSMVYTDKVFENATEDSSNIITDSAQTGEQDYSKTNIQVEGVDEADIVKTDGKYIYYLTNNKLTITDTTKMIKITDIEFNNQNFSPKEIFLREDRIIVIGIRREYTNNYRYTDYETFTSARVYNIKNRTKPILERTVEIEGKYLSSRMIKDDIYLISNKNIYSYLCKEYKINELDENDFKPQYKDTVTGKETKYIDFDRIYYIPEFEDTNYLNIASFNVTNKEEATIESYLGAGDEIYSSTDNLYITKVKYDYTKEGRDRDIRTEIYKFHLNEAKCIFRKSGKVPGSVLNQFSMDERDGYFRIATTDRSWNNEDNTNNLYVLDENLEIVGKVEGLAPGEQIYSVRFMGNRAYMVTFVQTDPLFVIDLSEPTNPTVLGELKIPGYSKYLHPYDETHLIGFGEDTKLVNYGYGDIVITDGIKIALFDVTDPNNPKEMYSEKIGKRGTYSELLNNHKALLFSKEKNIIAFPVSITEENYKVTFQGAIVYSLTLEKGFELKGKISNTTSEYERYYKSNNVQRILYIKDTLYTISQNTIKAVNMNTMEIKGTISL